MRVFEEEGKTIEEAINTALTKHKFNRNDVNIEILEEGSKGFLGLIGTKRAKIRITVKESRGDIERKKASIDKKEELDGQTIKIKEILEELLDKMGLNAVVDTKSREDEIIFNIRCEDDKLLIGRRGKTLDALEYLINLMTHKYAEDKILVTLDTSNYRAQRQQSLKNLALTLSRKVKNTGKPAVVEPLSPHDRKVIHMTLKNDPGIRATSRGNGFFQRIVISKSGHR
jgi:spoIIIJ-associated protein